MTRREALEHDALIVACAISAGIHAALAPAHGTAAVGFVAAAVLLAAIVAALTLRPSAPLPLQAAAAVLGGLLGSYGIAITVGVPVLHPEPEAVGALALATKLVEAAGLLAALHLLGRPHQATERLHPQPKGTLT